MTPERRSALTCTADTAVLKRMSDTSDVFVMALLDSSPDCIKLIERDGSLSYMNPNGQCAMEIDDFTMVAGAPWAALWPEASQAEIAASVDKALAGETTRIEAFCPTAKGRARWWDVSVSPVVGPDGEVARVLSVSRDITPIIEREDRLKAYDLQLKELNADLSDQLAKLDVMVREVDHRVKNSLAMIASMLRIQARKAEGAETQAALKDAAGRVATVARVHDQLQSGKDLAAVELDSYLPEVARDVASTLSRPGIAVCTDDIAAASMPSQRAVALGLIASELITNAYKHAFADTDEDCEIRVALQADGDTLRLSVADNGRGGCPPLDASSPGGGLGSRVVSMYAQELGATLDCQSPQGEGTTITLTWSRALAT